MSAKKGKEPKYRVRYSFSTGKREPPPHEVLSVVESEKARLRTMARLLEHPASTADMRERGEALLDDLAHLLASARTAMIGSKIGEARRRAAGDHKAEAVGRAIAHGADPLDLTSERNLRRIRSRKRK